MTSSNREECARLRARRTPSRVVHREIARRSIWPIGFLAPATIVVGFFFYTLSVMLQFSVLPSTGPGQVGDEFTLENYTRFLSSSFYLGYIFRSLWIAAYCTVITTVLGYVIAYFMYRSGAAVRIIAGTILIVQFFTAYVIRTFAVMLVIGKTGIINQILLGLGIVEEPLKLLFSEAGVAIGMVLISLPFMVFPIFSSLQTVPRNLEMAATSLGAGRLRNFWEVVFPLSLPGVAAGVVIVYLFELTSYIVPGILGGGYVDMIANFIYAKAMQSFDYPFAAAAAIVMLFVSASAIYLLQKAFRLITPRV